MCKLCNSDKYPICFKTHPKIKRSETSLKFCNIVQEYTGEFPCERCNKNYMLCVRGGMALDIDEYILKAFRRIFKIAPDKWYRLTHPEYNKNKVRKTPIKYILIEKYITKVACKTDTYEVSIQQKFKRHRKRCKTLEEARQFKQEVLNGNYSHTS